MAVFVQRQLAPDLCFVLHTRHPGKQRMMWLHARKLAACNALLAQHCRTALPPCSPTPAQAPSVQPRFRSVPFACSDGRLKCAVR